MVLYQLGIVLLLLLQLVHGYREEYRAFDNCGIAGWHCNNHGSDFEVSYDCSFLSNKNARLWVWTARIPSLTTILSVTDCAHVELHLDCTMGFRSYTLRQLRVTNVQHLDILRPLQPHVFLHDNDEVAHAPFEIIFTNISQVTWWPGVFEKPRGRCRYKQQVLTRVTFDKIKLQTFEKAFFRDQTLESLTWNQVSADSMQPASVDVSATNSISITKCNLGIISGTAFLIQGDTITFQENTIKEIESNGVSVKARQFNFKGNTVETINFHSFSVFARSVNISNNTLTRVKSGALELVRPGEQVNTNYKPAEKFTYEFSHNTVMTHDMKALLPNYSAYKDVCSVIVEEGNVLTCECDQEKLLQVNNTWENFFGGLMNSETNMCLNAPQCSLKQATQTFTRLKCLPDVNISVICNLIQDGKTVTESLTTASFAQEITQLSTIKTQETATPLPRGNDQEGISEETSVTVSGSLVGAVIIGLVLFVLAVAALTFFSRKRMKKTVSMRYQLNSANDDEENLIAERLDRANIPINNVTLYFS